MKGRIGMLRGIGNSTMGIGSRSSHLGPCAFFSSESSGGGRGRGRGQDGFNFVAGNTNEDPNEEPGSGSGAGHGHGRGNPSPSTRFLPSFDSFVAPDPIPNPPLGQPGMGRGRGAPLPQSLGEPKRPIYLKKEDDAMGPSSEAEVVESVPRQPIGEKNLPENILNVLTGTGRGGPERKTVPKERVKEENRHLRPRPVGAPGGGRGGERVVKGGVGVAKPKLSREEAVKKAVGVLSRDDEGRQAERGRRRRRYDEDEDDEDTEDEDEEEDDDEIKILGIGTDADGEELAKILGPSKMAQLTEAIDAALEEGLPEADEYMEALDTNLKVQPVHQLKEYLWYNR